MRRISMAWAVGLCLAWVASSPVSAGETSREEILRSLGDVPLRLADDDQDPKEAPGDPQEEKKKESPWLLAPIFSLNPKLGFAGGAIVGYMHYFDEKSKFSMIGINA